MNDNLNEQIWNLLRNIQNQTRQHTLIYCHQCGISIQDALLIHEVLNHPDISLVRLSQHLGLSKSTVSSMVFRLEERGVLLREIPPNNRRTIQLRVSTEYMDRPEVSLLRKQLVGGLFKEMNQEDADIILKGLEKLNEMIVRPSGDPEHTADSAQSSRAEE